MRKVKYGLTRKELERKLDRQDGKCEICGKTISLSDGKKTHVDHCHTSGVVRGILCRSCNVGIGHFQDSPETLERAADYLRHYAIDNTLIVNKVSKCRE